jgi:hypothetical protein
MNPVVVLAQVIADLCEGIGDLVLVEKREDRIEYGLLLVRQARAKGLELERALREES